MLNLLFLLFDDLEFIVSVLRSLLSFFILCNISILFVDNCLISGNLIDFPKEQNIYI